MLIARLFQKENNARDARDALAPLASLAFFFISAKAKPLSSIYVSRFAKYIISHFEADERERFQPLHRKIHG